MITTVTTITTITTITALGITGAISIVAVVSLAAFLITKELASAGGSGTSLRIARFLGVGLVPLIIAFAVIVAVKIASILV